MKFIPKKQTGELVQRYLQANQYSLNKPIMSAPAPANMITPNPAYFSPAETEANLARQAALQAKYNSSVTPGAPVNISGPTVIGQGRSLNYRPTLTQGQGQLTPRARTITSVPTATPVSVSGIQDLVDTWKSGQTSQTKTEPK